MIQLTRLLVPPPQPLLQRPLHRSTRPFTPQGSCTLTLFRMLPCVRSLLASVTARHYSRPRQAQKGASLTRQLALQQAARRQREALGALQ